MKLSAARLLNLIYYFFRRAVEHDKDKLKEFERALTQGQFADGRPVWWDDDDDAGQSSLAAAQALGLRPRG